MSWSASPASPTAPAPGSPQPSSTTAAASKPSSPATAYRDSLPTRHHPTYDHLLQLAAVVHETGLTASDSHAHMAGSEILVGLVDELIAVWDSEPARGLRRHRGRRSLRETPELSRAGRVA